jgi:hypothetical protein
VRRDITIEAPPRRSTKPKFRIMPENRSPRSAATGHSAAGDPDDEQREMSVTLGSHPDGTTPLCALLRVMISRAPRAMRALGSVTIVRDGARGDERQVDLRLLRSSRPPSQEPTAMSFYRRMCLSLSFRLEGGLVDPRIWRGCPVGPSSNAVLGGIAYPSTHDSSTLWAMAPVREPSTVAGLGISPAS